MPQHVPGLVARQRAPRSISIVVPCYNEADGLAELARRLRAVLQSFGVPYEVVLVDDGSRDRSWEIMNELCSSYPELKLVRLSRNYGHQLALTCGLDQANGEVTVIMDADLQDPPEVIAAMLEKWREGYDIAYGKRTKRASDSLSKRFFAFAFYRLIGRMTKIELPQDTGDFRLMDRRAVEALQSLRERHRFIRGMVSWIGYHQTPVHYERPERFAGETKYPFRKSLRLAIDAITSFSIVPLRAASVLGLAISLFAFAYIVVVIGLKIAGINFPGYTSLMASILLLGGVELMVMGIIGEYVGRIFEQGQLRPLYFIDRVVGEPLREPEQALDSGR